MGRAKEMYEEAIAVRPDDTVLRRSMADVLIMKEYAAATRQLEAIVEREPENLDAAAMLCRTWTWLKDSSAPRACSIATCGSSTLGRSGPAPPRPRPAGHEQPKAALPYLERLHRRFPREPRWPRTWCSPSSPGSRARREDRRGDGRSRPDVIDSASTSWTSSWPSRTTSSRSPSTSRSSARRPRTAGPLMAARIPLEAYDIARAKSPGRPGDGSRASAPGSSRARSCTSRPASGRRPEHLRDDAAERPHRPRRAPAPAALQREKGVCTEPRPSCARSRSRAPRAARASSRPRPWSPRGAARTRSASARPCSLSVRTTWRRPSGWPAPRSTSLRAGQGDLSALHREHGADDGDRQIRVVLARAYLMEATPSRPPTSTSWRSRSTVHFPAVFYGLSLARSRGVSAASGEMALMSSAVLSSGRTCACASSSASSPSATRTTSVRSPTSRTCCAAARQPDRSGPPRRGSEPGPEGRESVTLRTFSTVLVAPRQHPRRLGPRGATSSASGRGRRGGP